MTRVEAPSKTENIRRIGGFAINADRNRIYPPSGESRLRRVVNAIELIEGDEFGAPWEKRYKKEELEEIIDKAEPDIDALRESLEFYKGEGDSFYDAFTTALDTLTLEEQRLRSDPLLRQQIHSAELDGLKTISKRAKGSAWTANRKRPSINHYNLPFSSRLVAAIAMSHLSWETVAEVSGLKDKPNPFGQMLGIYNQGARIVHFSTAYPDKIMVGIAMDSGNIKDYVM